MEYYNENKFMRQNSRFPDLNSMQHHSWSAEKRKLEEGGFPIEIKTKIRYFIILFLWSFYLIKEDGISYFGFNFDRKTRFCVSEGSARNLRHGPAWYKCYVLISKMWSGDMNITLSNYICWSDKNLHFNLTDRCA